MSAFRRFDFGGTHFKCMHLSGLAPSPFVVSDKVKEEPAFLRHTHPSRDRCAIPEPWARPQPCSEEQSGQAPESHKWTPEP